LNQFVENESHGSDLLAMGCCKPCLNIQDFV